MIDPIYFIVIGVVGIITALLILAAVGDEKEVRAMTVASKSKQRKKIKLATMGTLVIKSSRLAKIKPKTTTKKAPTKRHKRIKVESKL